MWDLARRGTVLGLCWFALPSIGMTDEKAVATLKPADHFTLIRELREERLKLLSGAFHGEGHRVFAPNKKLFPDGKPFPLEGDLKFACEFDTLNHQVKWETERPFVEIDPKTSLPGVKAESFRFVRDGKDEFCAAKPSPLEFLPESPLRKIEGDVRLDPQGLPFDIRTFCLVDWASIDQGWTFDKASEAFDKCTITDAVEEADGRCCITIVPPNPTLHIKLWINPQRGYTAERQELRQRDEKTKELGPVMLLSEAKWEERNDVWVPVSMKLERHFERSESWEATLKWDRVNE